MLLTDSRQFFSEWFLSYKWGKIKIFSFKISPWPWKYPTLNKKYPTLKIKNDLISTQPDFFRDFAHVVRLPPWLSGRVILNWSKIVTWLVSACISLYWCRIRGVAYLQNLKRPVVDVIKPLWHSLRRSLRPRDARSMLENIFTVVESHLAS